MSDWINVKDKEPHEGMYLVYTIYGFGGVFMFWGHNWYDNERSSCANGYVTHYMPLPEPPKED